MPMIILASLALIFLILGLTAWFVFRVIRRAREENTQYQIFSQEHGYQYDRAQGNPNYRLIRRKTTKSAILVTVGDNPYVTKYANFKTYPFGRGGQQKVADVISGTYEGETFRAFTYYFTGSSLEGTGPGGTFSILLMTGDPDRLDLPDNVFAEDGMLCHYLPELLTVSTLHDRINDLKTIKRRPQ